MAPFKHSSVVVKLGTITIGLYTLYTILPTNQISTVFPYLSEVNKTRPPYKVVKDGKLHKSDLLWSNHDILSVDEWMRTMEAKHQKIKSNIAKACQQKGEDLAKSTEKIIDIFNQVKKIVILSTIKNPIGGNTLSMTAVFGPFSTPPLPLNAF